jgi:phosphoribosyl 1,2-cyclic phosphodiesterase
MKAHMTAKFWGVRGSIPSPGPSTARYGGNTPCVSIHNAGRGILVLDAGTGIRELGQAVAGGREALFILLSHSHWDHVQGFPFFIPIYEKNRKIILFPTRLSPDSPCGRCLTSRNQGTPPPMCPLLAQMDGAHFPVKPEDMASQPRCVTEDEMCYLHQQGFEVSRIPSNHPGGSFGYKIQSNGNSLVYLTDNELEPPSRTKATEFEGFVEFAHGADVLVHDAQYLEADMPLKHGWGHSLVSQACRLALLADVKHLVLYHHDPDRTDAELDAIQENARRWFAEKNHAVRCTVAFEGLSLEI